MEKDDVIELVALNVQGWPREIAKIMRLLLRVQKLILNVLRPCEEARRDIITLHCPTMRCEKCRDNDTCIFWNAYIDNIANEDLRDLSEADFKLFVARETLLDILDGIRYLKKRVTKILESEKGENPKKAAKSVQEAVSIQEETIKRLEDNILMLEQEIEKLERQG